MLIALAAGVPLGLITYATIAADDGAAAGAATGIATGLVTGGIAGGYIAWRERVWAAFVASVFSQYGSEGIVHHGPATFGRSDGFSNTGIDGWLVLTNQHLVFHPRGRGQRTLKNAVRDIAGARPGDSIAPNTILVVMRDRSSLEIRVRKRDEWLGHLANLEGIAVLR